MRLVLQFLFSFLLFICAFQVNSQNFLFVGNSLTYTNDLPKIVEEIAIYYDFDIKTLCLCKPNYAIIDHLNEPEIHKLLINKKFDYVIFQQGPSSQEEGKIMLLNDGAVLSQLAVKHGAQPAYLMVWPSFQYYHTFDAVILNHKTAAEKNNALLIPAGQIWKEYSDTMDNTKLYSVDMFHPSRFGSFLVGLSVFHALFPDVIIDNLEYSHYKEWIDDKSSFNQIINLVKNQ